MRIINQKDGMTEQTEELSINGASLVFYSVRVLNNPLSDEQLNVIDNSREFHKIHSGQGYIEKIFILNNYSKDNHLSYVRKNVIDLSPLKIENGSLVVPKVTHYINVYNKNILLIQSVIIFDKSEVTKYNGVTKIDKPIKTDDILKIIHNIKIKDEIWNKEFSSGINDTVEMFLTSITFGKLQRPSFFAISSDKNEQCLSVQIWDIASLKINDGEDVIGEELASRYELEISAILSCYNEHFTKNGLWKKQSANQVIQSVKLRTDVLNDHKILRNERVCVEISQVNHPEFRDISAIRLCTYGYDSTSMFLWGYLVIMCAGFEMCDIKSNKLRDTIVCESKNYENNLNHDGEKVYKDIIHITAEMQEISKEMDLLSLMDNMCIEERHRDFMNEGAKIRGLTSLRDHVKENFKNTKEISSMILSTDSSKSSNEISELLKEVQEIKFKNEKTATVLSVISIIIGCTFVIPITEFVTNTFPQLNNYINRLQILAYSTGIVVIALLAVWIALKKK